MGKFGEVWSLILLILVLWLLGGKRLQAAWAGLTGTKEVA